ncbi:hypothetical protein Y032_0477g2161 [Ancylostoma ceylanicum]|nr:hypothetical protein Y032_0477g2161 [Ancylostoma ceylanicum]
MSNYYYSSSQSGMFLQAETDFGMKMLRQTSINETCVVSPVSVILALATIHIGAKGQTKSQISRAISTGATDTEIVKYYSHLSEEIVQHRKGTATTIANGFFMDKKFAVRKSYGSALIKRFTTKVRSFQFKGNYTLSEKIDSYVSRKTYGRIKHIHTPRNLNDALSLLVSAASFASKWEYSFVKTLNTRGIFYSRVSSERKVEYMNVVKENRYYTETENMQVLSLRYSDTSYALNIFLPREKFALETLRASLTGSVIQTTLSQLKSTYMTISIPKMRIKTELKLKTVLRALGVSELFSDHCDLSGITKTSAFKISHAAHKAIIEIGEGGTTEKDYGNYYKPVIETEPTYAPTTFIADHPFLFVLTKDNNPLFIGQYV